MVTRTDLEHLVNDGFPLETQEELSEQTMCCKGVCLIPDQLMEEEYAHKDHDGDWVHSFDCGDEVVVSDMLAQHIDEVMEEVAQDDDEIVEDDTPEMGCSGDHEEPCGSECVLND